MMWTVAKPLHVVLLYIVCGLVLTEERFVCKGANNETIVQLDCSENEFVALQQINVGNVSADGCRRLKHEDPVSDKLFREFRDKVSGVPTSSTTMRYTSDANFGYIFVTYYCIRSSVIKDMCTEFDLSDSLLSIWSEGYGHGISNYIHSDCNCSISAAPPSILIHTYNKNLTPQQNLTLVYANGSVLTEWKHANVETLNLTWHNGDVSGHGKFWIGFEGNITLRCYKAFTVTSSAFTTTATSMYSTTTKTTPATKCSTTAKTISTTTANRTATTAFVDTTLTLAVTSPIAIPIEQTDATSSTNATVESPTPKSDKIWIIIGVCIAAAVLLLILVVVGIVYFVSAKNRNQQIHLEDEQNPTSNVGRLPPVFSVQHYPHEIQGIIYEQEHDLTERKQKRKKNKKKKKRKHREDVAETDELYSTIDENGGFTTE